MSDIHLKLGESELLLSEEAATHFVQSIFARVLAPTDDNKFSGFIGSIRIAIKGAIRPFLPAMLKDLYERIGEPPPQIPRARDADLLDWLIPLLAGVGIRQIGKTVWRLELATLDSEKRLYQICALAPESAPVGKQPECTSSIAN